MATFLRASRMPARSGLFAARATFTKAPARRFSAPSSPPPPPAAKSNATLFIGLGVTAVIAGGALWAYSSSDAVAEGSTAGKSVLQKAKVAANWTPTKEDYQKVYNRIADILDVENYDDGSYAPILVRLAWHSSGTYDKDTKTGGSNYATMRFHPESAHGANAGLNVARNLLEDIKKEFPWISYGDLWTLGGVVGIQEAGGPRIPWRPGRIDGFEKDATPDGRLPDAAQAQDHLRAIFYRMGFNDQEIVALSGAHSLGRCHPDRSGFDGPWTFSPVTFSNSFFSLLLDEKWVWRKWSGPKQLEDKKTKSLMMLPSDYALVQDKVFKQWTKKYAQDEALFFNDFSKAFHRMLELGVPEGQWASPQPWEMKTVDEQGSK